MSVRIGLACPGWLGDDLVQLKSSLRANEPHAGLQLVDLRQMWYAEDQLPDGIRINRFVSQAIQCRVVICILDSRSAVREPLLLRAMLQAKNALDYHQRLLVIRRTDPTEPPGPIRELDELSRGGQLLTYDRGQRIPERKIRRIVRRVASSGRGTGPGQESVEDRGETPGSTGTGKSTWTPLSFHISAAADPARDGVVYPVWFATNRKPNQARDGFLGERDQVIRRGRVDVHVPEAHRFGETGTSFWKRLRRLDLRDDHLRVEPLINLEKAAFYQEIEAVLEQARAGGDQRHALVFLHGYNVTFEEAAIRAAQIGFDLKVPGATAFFSWPSSGHPEWYTADEASIEASEGAITDFLTEFVATCKADKVHLIAHSMGNRGLLRALHRIACRAAEAGPVKFNQIVLAAPDVDRDLFLDLARIFPTYATRTTLYASGDDIPVLLSQKFHNAPRAGYFPPYTIVEGIDTIAVPGFDVGLLGHSYFAEAAALLHDIFDLIRHDLAPSKRQRVEPASDGVQAFWRLRR